MQIGTNNIKTWCHESPLLISQRNRIETRKYQKKSLLSIQICVHKWTQAHDDPLMRY